MSSETASRVEAENKKHLFPFYYVITGVPNLKCQIPELSQAYMDLVASDESGKLAEDKPKSVEPHWHSFVTAEMLKDMTITAEPNGDYVTDCPFKASKMLAAGQSVLGSDARMHERSMALPEKINPPTPVDVERAQKKASKK